jgi:hypothetical protein
MNESVLLSGRRRHHGVVGLFLEENNVKSSKVPAQQL